MKAKEKIPVDTGVSQEDFEFPPMVSLVCDDGPRTIECFSLGVCLCNQTNNPLSLVEDEEDQELAVMAHAVLMWINEEEIHSLALWIREKAKRDHVKISRDSFECSEFVSDALKTILFRLKNGEDKRKFVCMH